ncbi:esterase-like activity of phytase family protein [Pseudoroseicyclus tamaricis]|uniref:Esterase-like activity of phytase family protein n=1 Tax=Pseudoroseicyclus tamaricis TaxID=2705421 RepID=A0A6B2K245_9RHOB|nr:esterase-like activity of phytase family protein [Pseudoroseicyclus tamaricis]NDV00486.1 esterase-like activity of phytase family protein [Pseudoroseicyclus tamaricis]
MSLRTTLLAALLGTAAAPALAQEAREFPATLTAHAQLPGATFLDAPEDAPAYFQRSGRFTAGARVEEPGAITDEVTGLSRPFEGQPLQGFSGIRSLGDDRFLVLTDNGFGSKANSADVILMFNIVSVDWEAGAVNVEETIRLHDPDMVVPFPIIAETTESRYLTGADFDLESIQPVGDHYWLGDEFGPWLIETDSTGRVLQVIATEPAGELIQGPDNAFLSMPNPGGTLPAMMSQRSGGYEGMALSEDGTTLYPLLEKPVFDAATGAAEEVSGRPVLRIFEYDTEGNGWGDRTRYYPLEDAGHAIGDFNIIEGTRALIIERDNGTGDARDGWAETPAEFKRIYLVDLEEADENGVLRKIAYIDLMNIQDPEGLAPRGSVDGVFTFPFVTIEDVDRVDETTIVVANDNNYPFSVGREEGVADDNEMILLDVAEFLTAE